MRFEGRSRFTMSRLALMLWTVILMTGVVHAVDRGEGPYHRLVIRGVTVIDGTGAPPYGPVDIVIERDRISRIIPFDPVSGGDTSKRPTGDRIIEAEGAYVIPGIMDMHAHLSNRVPRAYIYKLWLAHGVTTVRLVGVGDVPSVLKDKKRSEGPDLVAPRIFLYGFWREPRERRDDRYYTPEGARAIVREWKKMGLDGVKMTGRPGLYPDVLAAITDEAQRLGMGVAVHIGQDGVYPMNAVRVAETGVTTIEHHYGYAEAALSERTVQNLAADYNYLDEKARFRVTAAVWLEADLNKLMGPVLERLVSLSRQGEFTMDPTFAVYEANRNLARAQNLPWHQDFTHPALMEAWLPNPRLHATYHFAWTSMDEALWAQMFRRWMTFVNAFKNRGGHVTVGSDPGYIYQTYGFGTIREMELLEEAGFHPLEVIRSATQEGARVLKRSDMGILRPGYRADLVIVTENPLNDLKVFYGTGLIRYTEKGEKVSRPGVLYTIRNGVVFDAQALLKDIRTIVADAKKTKD